MYFFSIDTYYIIKHLAIDSTLGGIMRFCGSSTADVSGPQNILFPLSSAYIVYSILVPKLTSKNTHMVNHASLCSAKLL